MKRVLSLVVLLLLSTLANAAPAFVAAWTGAQGNTVSSPFATAAVDTTGGNFVAACVTFTGTITGVTDNMGNGAYSLIGPFVNGGDDTYLAYKENATTGAGHAVSMTWAAGNGFATISAAAYSGIVTTSAIDQQEDGSGSGTALNSGNMSATTVADELIIGCGTVSVGSAVTWTSGASFTVRSQVTDASIGGVSVIEDRIVSSTGVYAATATSNQSGPWVMIAATFEGTGGGGGGSAVPKILQQTAANDDHYDELRPRLVANSR